MSYSKKPEALPTLHGVSASCVVVQSGAWRGVLDFLQTHFPHIPASEWRQRFADGLVVNQQGHALRADAPCMTGEKLYYWRHCLNEPEAPLSEHVLYQDAHVVVADKPHFMPVTPAGRYVQRSLLVRLKQRLGLAHLSPVHRIDRETAGLVLFSVRPQERAAYHALFTRQQVHKLYHAVAPVMPHVALPCVHKSRLQPDAAFFKSCAVAGEPNSETLVALLKQEGTAGLYALTPRTGQRHQLRVHMNALGLPIEGDQFYPQVLRGPQEEDDHSRTLQLLAKELAFTDPITGESRHFVSRQQLRIRAD